MHPILVDFGTWNLPLFGETHLFLPTYGVLFASAVVLAWWWFVRRARSLGISDEALFNLSFYSLLAGILGAKLLLILVDWRYYLSEPSAILGTLRSAGVLAGGVLAGGLVFWLYCRTQGLPTFRLGDAIAAPLALAQAVGRLGCFSAGCCWGVHTAADSPLAVVFTDPTAHAQTGVPLGQPLIAIQLVQSAGDLLLAGVLTLLWRRRPAVPGTVFWIYVLVYSVMRGTIEFWRGDAQRGVYFGGHVSTTQLIAGAAALLAAAMLLAHRRRARAA